MFREGTAVLPGCTTDYIRIAQHGTAWFSLPGTGSQLHMQLLSSPLPGTIQTQTQTMLSCWKSFSFAWIHTGDILLCIVSGSVDAHDGCGAPNMHPALLKHL